MALTLPNMKPSLFLCGLLLALPVAAATLHVKPTASGAGNGTTWTDALGSNFTPVRGNTYYFADGSYGSGTTIYSTAQSGSTLITFRKATVADHGSATGWSDTLGDGVATWGEIKFTTDYWYFDGQKRNASDWADDTSYGFRVDGFYQRNYDTDVSGDFITVRHVNIGGTKTTAFSEGHPTAGFYFAGFTATINNWTVENCYVHNVDIPFHVNGADNVQISGCYLGPSWQKEAIRGQISSRNLIVANNIFRDTCQAVPGESGDGRVSCTAVIACWDGTSGSWDGIQIYGNLIVQTHNTTHTDGIIMVGGDGGSTAAGATANNCLVYNNTIIGVNQGTAVIRKNGSGSGNIARNNIWSGLGGSVTTGSSFNTTSDNNVLATSVFVNYAGGNFHLSGAQAGTSLGSTYQTDIDGVTRGGDGTWDEGAFEYGSGTINPPVITSSLAVVATNSVAFSYSITTSNSATSFGATPLPIGLSHSAGTILGTPSLAVSYSTNTTITATNSSGSDSEVLVITVYNGLAPTFTTSPVAKTNSEATGVVLTSAATTTYGSVTYQWQSNSVNISGATSANYSKVPAAVAPDSGLYRVIASNSWGSITSSAVYVSITNASAPPVITPANLSGTINQAITAFQINATEGPTAYGAANLQAGLSVNGSTGLITGTPTVASTNTVTLSATNAYGYDQENVTFSIASVVGTNISVGSRVAVNISPTLRVRDAAALAGNILGEQNYLAEGTVLSGPTTVDGYVWWEINYDSAPDGWSIEGTGGSYWLIVAPPDGDTTAPSISITSPAHPTTTNMSVVNITGTASDNVGLSLVDYVWFLNGVTHDTGTATGTDSWTFSRTLLAGSNYFQVKAVDTSSNTNAAGVGITYIPARRVTVGTLRL